VARLARHPALRAPPDTAQRAALPAMAARALRPRVAGGAARAAPPPPRVAARWRRCPLPPHASAAEPSDAAAEPPVLAARCMEEACDALAARALAAADAAPPGRRLVVGVAGAPGAGKSTLAREVVRRANVLAGAEVAVNVPMDGFHLTRAQLDALPDPAAARARRGAPWTFDAPGYVACLRAAGAGAALAAPSFDHGRGDPAPGDIAVGPGHRLVVSEGNYLLLEESPWGALVDEKILDEAWYVDLPLDAAMARVARRQEAGGAAPAAAAARVAANDRPNGECVAASRGRATLVVKSVAFAGGTPGS
jgi:pantothenate kinase